MTEESNIGLKDEMLDWTNDPQCLAKGNPNSRGATFDMWVSRTYHHKDRGEDS